MGGRGIVIMALECGGGGVHICSNRWETVNGGVFAHAHSANHYDVHPGNAPENHPPTEACMIHSKHHRGCRIQDPGTRGYWGRKTADFSHSAQCAPNATLLTCRHSMGVTY